MLTFLLVLQAIVAVFLVGVILMQQSEGGGLGMGGSPSGLMSARGAADFLTRATTILAAIFIALSILHAVLATQTNRGGDIDTSLAKTAPAGPPANPTVPVGGAPATGAPAPVPVPGPIPVPATPAPTVPIAAAPKSTPPREQPRPTPRRTEAQPVPTVSTTPPPVVTTTPAPSGNSN